MSPSSRNVGRPANASFHRCALRLADRNHLSRVEFGRLAPAAETAAAPDGGEILKLARSPTLARRYPRDLTFYVADPLSSIRARSLRFLHFTGRRSCIVSGL